MDIRKTVKRLARMEKRCDQKIHYYEKQLEQVVTQTSQKEKKLIDKALDVFKLRSSFHFRR
jgi:vacuolar-type H+-ATPase subunit H